MMELITLYKNDTQLFKIESWYYTNLKFDKSIGELKKRELFRFLEKLDGFDYENKATKDEFYFLITYTQKSILKIISNLKNKIIRTHQKLNIQKAKEFDSKTLLWLSKQEGLSIKQKLKDNKILAVKRELFYELPENVLFKKFLKSIYQIYLVRDDLGEFERLFYEIKKWLKSNIAKIIDDKKIVSANNTLLHHKNYFKIYTSFVFV